LLHSFLVKDCLLTEGIRWMSYRVLIADDSKGSRAMLRQALEALGSRVVEECASGREAVRLIGSLKPDVVILAVGLSDGSGIDAARTIMETHPCPIVLLTSHTDPETVEGARETGIMAYLVKPLRPEELGPTLVLAVSRFEEFQAIRHENAGLRKSLESRKVIERAKGFLMKREGLSEAEAFRKIRKLSMDRRRPMAEIAEALLLVEDRGEGGSSKLRGRADS